MQPWECTQECSPTSLFRDNNPDGKGHGPNMGPTWALSAPDGPHVGPMNLAISDTVCGRTCKVDLVAINDNNTDWCSYINSSEGSVNVYRGEAAASHDDVIKWKHFRVTGPLCGNSPVTGEFPSQRPVTRSFDVFFDLRLNEGMSKQSWSWWFETPSRPLWRHCNGDHEID